MVKRLVLVLFLVMVFVSFGSAVEQDLGTAIRGSCINLVQTCDSCTYNNISRVLYPNSTEALTSEQVMTVSGIYYNYSFCSTDAIGEYVVLGHGDLNGEDTIWDYTFEITREGESISTPKAIMYTGLLFVLAFLFIVSTWVIFILPSKNDRDEDGMLLSVNRLKYLRAILMVVSWVLLISIVFVSSNISLAFFSVGMFGNLLFDLYQIMMYLTIILPFIWVGWIIVSLYQDREIQKMLDRGVEMGGRI